MPDTQSLILFAAAMVAGIVCFRLFMILGRRAGHEPQPGPDRAEARRNAATALEAPRVDVPSSSGLVEIQLADRNFDTAHFVSGAREAYGRIVRAFAAGDRAALAPLVSPAVAEAFDAAITARGDAPAANLAGLRDARIVGASLEGRHAEITLSFRAEFAGEPPQEVTDVWTFARELDSADPNWTLVATSGDLPE